MLKNHKLCNFNYIKDHFNYIQLFLFFLLFLNNFSCQKHKISKNPQKIVSLSPSLTQIVFALKEGKKIVAVTKYDFYPKNIKNLPVIGGFLDVNLEKILSFQPDLVLLSEMHSVIAAKLKELGVPFLILKTRNISETYETINILGKKLNAKSEADKLIKQLKTKLVKHICKQTPNVLITLGHLPNSLKNLVAAGKGTYLDEILTLAGGKNIISTKVASYPSLSAEELISLKPDIIIDLTLKKSTNLWSSVKFLKQPKIYMFTSPKYSSPGIFFPFILENFQKVICKSNTR